MINAILTDIEGTTSSLSFVKDVLFPYARERLAEFVRSQAHEPAVRSVLTSVSEIMERPLTDEAAIAQLLSWSDEDKKVTPLKELQGLIWEHGYRNGALHGHIYEDARRYLLRWKEAGLKLYVFSSGSVLAQKLLFGHTEYGDLTPLFSGYFDTTIGAKREPSAYRAIAQRIGAPPETILFLSDIVEELDAARSAGMATTWLVRNGSLSTASSHPLARQFEEIQLNKQNF